MIRHGIVYDVCRQQGTIVETLTSQDIPTGNVYKLTGEVYPSGQAKAYKAFRQGQARLHISTRCRVLENDGTFHF